MAQIEGQQELDLWLPGRDEPPDRQQVPVGLFTAARIPAPLAPNLPDVSAHWLNQDALSREWHAEDLVGWSTRGYTSPEIVRSIWRSLEMLGFERGRVLEPGGGGGAFTAMAPAGAEMTRIEMLEVNARRAEQLCPEAVVRWESFAASRFPRGHFDAVVGSIPRGRIMIPNPRSRRGGDPQDKHLHRIDEGFLLRSLSVTRPGGVVAVVASHSLLDDPDARVRRRMYKRADLLGAVRMPNEMHYQANGRASGGDVLIFRRRQPGVESAPAAWVHARETEIDGRSVHVNGYFIDHPEKVLGRLGVHPFGSSAFLEVHGDVERAPGQVADALVDIVFQAGRDGYACFRPELARGGERDIAERGDLWDMYREALVSLGDGRATELLRRAAAHRKELPEVDEALLLDRRDAALDALARLDHGAARAVFELERRQQAVDASAGHEAIAASTAEELERLPDLERHPDQWMERDGLVVAEWVASERVRAREREIAIQGPGREPPGHDMGM